MDKDIDEEIDYTYYECPSLTDTILVLMFCIMLLILWIPSLGT